MHFLISSLWNIWRYKIKRANLVLCSNGHVGIKVCNLYCRYCIDCFLTQRYRHRWHNYNSSDEPVWIWDPLQWPFFFKSKFIFDVFDCRDENSYTTQCFPKKNVTILCDSCMKLSSWEIILKATPRVLSSASPLQTKIKVMIEFHSGSSQWRHTSLLYSLFSSVQSLSRIRLFATPWTAACQASLSITNSQSLLKFMSIKLVMSSNHLILCPPSLPAFNLSQHQGLFQWVSPSYQVAKVLELQLQH